MKAIFALMVALLLCSFVDAGQPANDWMQLELESGTRVSGYVVKVTEKNVHLVGASINRLIPKTQLSEKSRQQLGLAFPVTITAEPAETTTATALKADLQHQREQLYQSVSDIYSPRSYRYRSTVYRPYQRSYYLPQGYSIAYPVYRRHYRPHYSFPRWNIQIDL